MVDPRTFLLWGSNYGSAFKNSCNWERRRSGCKMTQVTQTKTDVFDVLVELIGWESVYNWAVLSWRVHTIQGAAGVTWDLENAHSFFNSHQVMQHKSAPGWDREYRVQCGFLSHVRGHRVFLASAMFASPPAPLIRFVSATSSSSWKSKWI